MVKKTPSKEVARSLDWFTIDHIIEIFNQRRALLANRKLNSKQHDENLPRVPYKVKQVLTKSPNEIAHFHEYFKDPPEILGKLTLERPDFGKSPSPKSKKAK